jgi:hypothetical protein
MTKTTDAINAENRPQIHIKISDDGEICAWGLDQEQENQLLNLTGNHDLADLCKTMSFNLCG